MNVLLVMALALSIATGAYSAGLSARIDARGDGLLLVNGRCELRVSLASPDFVFADGTVAGVHAANMGINVDLLSGKLVEISYPTINLAGTGKLDVRLHVQWSKRESVLRKWASYRVTSADSKPLLKEVILERVAIGGSKISVNASPPQSAPAFGDGFFAGVEFPVASTRIEDNRCVLAHSPGLQLSNGIWYNTRKAVYAVTEPGSEKQAFRRYVELNHPRPKGLHVNYNSWWTSPVPYKEADIESLMAVFEEKLVKPHKAHFDTFCIDMGWSVAKSAWEIDRSLFPDGFSNIETSAKQMQCDLGLWISPSSCYSPAMDNEWAKENGYETFPIDSQFNARRACLAGSKYRAAITNRLVEAVTKYGVRHIKLDGYSFDCPQSNHGHEPGVLSSEAVAEGMTSMMKAVRKACPGVWLEPTCFGPNPSPWWLFSANSVTGFFGDDAPYGRVPSPIYRESYTTARDYFNLQGAALLPIPISGQEILGIVHQSSEPFTNDAIMCVMRGNMFLPVYVNPRFMNDARLKSLARILNWARENETILAETEPLLPASWKNSVPVFSYDSKMPHEPYGYAHWSNGRGLIVLRNPWIVPTTYPLEISKAVGAKGISVVSLYPQTRVYAKNLKGGDTLNVPLAPYETVVLSISAKQKIPEVPAISTAIGSMLKSSGISSELKNQTNAVEFTLDGEVTVKAPQAQLLILIEDDKAVPEKPVCHITINGKEQLADTRASIDTWRMPDDATEIGWAASSLPAIEHWRFLRASLTEGTSNISVNLTAGGNPRISAYVWAMKPGGSIDNSPNALSEPEIISLDGMQLK